MADAAEETRQKRPLEEEEGEAEKAEAAAKRKKSEDASEVADAPLAEEANAAGDDAATDEKESAAAEAEKVEEEPAKTAEENKAAEEGKKEESAGEEQKESQDDASAPKSSGKRMQLCRSSCGCTCASHTASAHKICKVTLFHVREAGHTTALLQPRRSEHKILSPMRRLWEPIRSCFQCAQGRVWRSVQRTQGWVRRRSRDRQALGLRIWIWRGTLLFFSGVSSNFSVPEGLVFL